MAIKKKSQQETERKRKKEKGRSNQTLVQLLLSTKEQTKK